MAVLRELHDELDAAVLAAYGWADLAPTPSPRRGDGRDGAHPLGSGQAMTPAAHTELLIRLLALNQSRAAEELEGRVRWLRPDFQNPQQPAPGPVQAAFDGMDAAPALTARSASAAPMAPAPIHPWPAALPEQVRAVADILASSTHALPLSVLEARFKGRGPWKKSLPRILDTLEALGRARREGAGWRG